jgi:TolB-like protein
MKLRILGFMLLAYTAAVFAGEQWITTGSDIGYPNEMYFVGVGVSERSLDAAKQSAVVEIKKQISVKVSASMLDEQIEVSKSGGQGMAMNRTESRARLTTSGQLQGVEVVKTTTQGKLFYALAVLDKNNFITNCKAQITEQKQQLGQLIDGANADIAAAKMPAALKKLSEAKKLIAGILEIRTMLSAAAPITEAEQLNYTMTDIAGLYEKCIATIRMKKVSGDKQSFAVGMVPAEPFVVQVATTDGTPVPMIPVILLDGTKRIIEQLTDDNGQAQLLIGEKADMAAGTHSYTAAIGLQVSSSMKSIMTAQNQSFSYTVQSNPCYAKIVVDVSPSLASGKADIVKKVTARLAKFDLKNDPEADNTLKVSVTATDAGGVTGLSESNSFLKTEVTMALELVDDNGKELGSIQGTGKGMGGSFIKSASQGIDNVRIDKDLKSLLEKMGSAQPAGPKPKIAVFEFKNRGYYAYWYDLSVNLSDMLITKLINSGKYDVVERSQLDKIMEEKSLAQSGVVEENEAMQAAQLAGAELVLVGSVNIAGEKIEADARIIDIKTGIAKCAMSSSAFSLSDMRALADDLAGKIKSKCYK